MTDEEWDKLLDEEDEEEDLEDTIFTGMLSIGTLGCSFDMMLVLKNFDLEMPFFTFERHFLDWYERWLDEVIHGYKISWFGMNLGGDEQELIQQFYNSQEEEWKQLAMRSMHKFPQLLLEMIDFLEQQLQHESKEIRNISLQLLLKYDYEKAKPFLTKMIQSEEEDDQLKSIQSIYWFAKGKWQDWTADIERIEATNPSSEIKKYIGYILNRNQS